MPDQPPGKNVVQIATCRNCGKRFQTRVLTNAGLCADCEGELSFTRKPEPAPATPPEAPEFGRSPNPAVTPHTPRARRHSHRRGSHRRPFVQSNRLTVLLGIVIIGIAFAVVLTLFQLDANREAARLEAIKANQPANPPAPVAPPGSEEEGKPAPVPPEPAAEDDAPPEP